MRAGHLCLELRQHKACFYIKIVWFDSYQVFIDALLDRQVQSDILNFILVKPSSLHFQERRQSNPLEYVYQRPAIYQKYQSFISTKFPWQLLLNIY